MTSDLIFYLVAGLAVFIVGVSKGGFAGGLVMIHVPLMAFVMSPLAAAALMLPLLILMDAASVWTYRTRWSRPDLLILLSGSLLGLAIGYATAAFTSDALVRIVVGAIAVCFVLYQTVIAPRMRKTDAAKPPSWSNGAPWGALAGYTSFIANAGSPPFQAYLIPRRLDKSIHQGTSVMFFAIVNAIKLGLFASLGQLKLSTLTTAAFLAPAALAGVAFGVWLHKRANDALYYKLMYLFTFVLGLKLLWDGLAASFQ